MEAGFLPELITIYGNTSQSARIAEIALFINQLRKAGIPLEIWSEFAGYLQERNVNVEGIRRVEEPSENSGMVLTLGGDGTLLHAAAWCGIRRLPLLGINTGHLGFLTAYTLSETHMLIPDLRGGNLVTERRTLLQLSSPEPEKATLPADLWPCALNEVAVLKADSSSMISVSVTAHGSFLTDYRADGLIISTPTGSTGYSLSAGGPVMEPQIDCLVLTPIAPHTLSIRPIVVGADTLIELRTTSRDGSYRVALDGRSFTMPADTVLRLRSAEKPLLLMRRRDVDFATTLRTKLHWGHPE